MTRTSKSDLAAAAALSAYCLGAGLPLSSPSDCRALADSILAFWRGSFGWTMEEAHRAAAASFGRYAARHYFA